MMNFVIIGIGLFGRTLAIELAKKGFDVTIVDERESAVSEIKNHVTYAKIGDATDIQVLRSLNLNKDTCVIIAVGESFERNLLIAAQLTDKEFPKLKIYARCVNDLQGRVLKAIGVNELVRVEEVAACQLATRFIDGDLMNKRKIDDNYSVAEVNLPDEWVGKSLAEVDMRHRFRLNLLTLRRGQPVDADDGEDVIRQPKQAVIDIQPETHFQTGDVLVLFGKNGDLRKFAEKFGL